MCWFALETAFRRRKQPKKGEKQACEILAAVMSVIPASSVAGSSFRLARVHSTGRRSPVLVFSLQMFPKNSFIDSSHIRRNTMALPIIGTLLALGKPSSLVGVLVVVAIVTVIGRSIIPSTTSLALRRSSIPSAFLRRSSSGRLQWRQTQNRANFPT